MSTRRSRQLAYTLESRGSSAMQPTERLRQAFPQGQGTTPWAGRPDAVWICELCGTQAGRQSLATATVVRRPWGTQVRWQATEWHHFVQAGIPGDGTIVGVEAAMRLAIADGVAAARWNLKSQRIERARGRLVLRGTAR